MGLSGNLFVANRFSCCILAVFCMAVSFSDVGLLLFNLIAAELCFWSLDLPSGSDCFLAILLELLVVQFNLLLYTEILSNPFVEQAILLGGQCSTLVLLDNIDWIPYFYL